MPNITVSQATTATRLVSVDAIRTRLGVGTSFDTVLGDIVDEASAVIVKYLDYDLAYQVYSEDLPGFDDSYLLLSRVPIVGSVTSITNSTGSTISSTGYEIHDRNAGVVFSSTGWGWDTRWQTDIVSERESFSEDQNYTVTYNAGYRLPGTTNSTWLSTAALDLPFDIRRAALLTAIEWFGATNLRVTTTQYRIIRTEDYWIENQADVRTRDILEEGLPKVAQNLLRPYVMNLYA